MRNSIRRLRGRVPSLIFCAVALFAAPHAGAQTPSAGGRHQTERFKGREVVAGQVLVKFSASATPQDVERAKAGADVEHERRVGGRGVRLLRSRSKDVETLVRELSARGDVVYAEPNYIIRANSVPNDPGFVEQWGLRNTGSTAAAGAGTPGADIGALAAWNVSTGSRDNVVAVIDTGVDSSHPDLAANMWSAPAPFTVNIGGQVIRCEAGTHGFNAVTKTCDPADEYDHGTHVAGIVGAAGNNGVGGSGVNWTASIMDIKFIDATGSGTLADAADAIEFAIQAKQALGAGANVRVLSNSWGWNGEPSQLLLDQINRAGGSDMLFVAGAGNGGEDRAGDNNDVTPFYPAGYDASNVVAVAATDNKDALASFSNYSATRVHLGAPGVLIYSTVMGGRYDWWSGTSMATPQVSGAAALVLSRCALDTAGLKNVLLNNVDYVAALSGVTATGGRLDVSKALGSCVTSTPTPTPTPTPAANSAPAVALTGPADGWSFTAPANVTLSASASDADGAVSRVDFYVGTQLLGTSYAGPYTFTWGNVAAGAYSLKAVATDDRGAATTSAAVSIYVNQPPAAGTGTTGRIAKWSDGGAGMLGDSIITESGGNVGVGTASPTNPLTVYSDTSVTPALIRGVGNNALGFGVQNLSLGSKAWIFQVPGSQTQTGVPNGSFIFRQATDNLNAMVISPLGHVGVGTATPKSTLQVNGYLQLGLTSAAPPAADCDDATEYGRMKIDAVNVKLYICTSAGWKFAALQ